MICSLFIFTVLILTGCQSGDVNITIGLPTPTISPVEPAVVIGDDTNDVVGLQTPTSFPVEPAVVIGDATFDVELANTPPLRTQGLSDRPSLPEQTGMLFIFDSGRTSQFWMYRMQFPLDFVWIGENCTVVDVTEEW